MMAARPRPRTVRRSRRPARGLRRSLAGLFAVLAPALAACGGGGAPAVGPDPGAPPLVVSPAASAPGEALRVLLDRAPPSEGRDVAVSIGGRPAIRLRVLGPAEVEVLVPVLPLGPARVEAVEGGALLGRGWLEVLTPPSRRVTLRLDADGVALVAACASSDRHDPPNAARGRRLAYDVFSEGGGLVATGAVPHPMGRGREVYADPAPGGLRRAPAPQVAVTDLVVPHVPGALRIVLYEVDDGVDLTTVAGRAARVRVGEVRVAEGGA